MEKKTYTPRPDTGTLFASQSKKYPNSPDYFGTLVVNMRDTTNIQVVDGVATIKLSGWKKQGSSGKTYLSVGVDRYIPKQAPESQPVKQAESDDSDIPF